jgi:hypothetical protein
MEKRVRAKGWMLEWKNLHVSKEAALSKVLEASKSIGQVNCAVMVKSAEDTGPIVRGYIQYEKKVSWNGKKAGLWDKAGVYKPQRSWKIVLPYMKPINWVSYGIDIGKALQRKKSRKR